MEVRPGADAVNRVESDGLTDNSRIRLHTLRDRVKDVLFERSIFKKSGTAKPRLFVRRGFVL